MKIFGFLATFKYRFIAGVAILAALAISMYAVNRIGYHKGKNISAVEISKYQNKVSTLQGRLIEAQSRVQIQTIREYITKVEFVDRVVEKNNEIIKNVLVSRPETISTGAIYAHNQAALNAFINPTLAADPSQSGISDANLIASVADNYGIANRCAIQVDSLQKYIIGNAEARKNVKK